jgi:hypothetical protein
MFYVRKTKRLFNADLNRHSAAGSQSPLHTCNATQHTTITIIMMARRVLEGFEAPTSPL